MQASVTDSRILGVVDEEGFVWTRPRQIFVQLYVATDGDAKAAARDARLEEDPQELLDVPSVQAAIESLYEKVFARHFETRDSVISRLANVAEGNAVDYFDITAHPTRPGAIQDMRPKDLRKLPIHMQKRVKKISLKYTAQGDQNWELELHDPMTATRELARILGLYNEENTDLDASDFAEAIHELLTKTDFEHQGRPEDHEKKSSEKAEK